MMPPAEKKLPSTSFPSLKLRSSFSSSEIGFLVFIATAFLMGGGSRADIDSLALLRFMSAAALGICILTLHKEAFNRIRVPVGLLAAIAFTALIQLIPVPPSLWKNLPERALIAELDGMIGLQVWRPITLSPSATLNSLFSLVVPLAGLVLFAGMRKTDRALEIIVTIGAVSAALGILQLFGDPQSGLYFYEITNNGSAVGLFANRNHQAVFLACCLLICTYLALSDERDAERGRSLMLLTATPLLGFAILINGSRAGLIALVMVALLSAVALVLAPRQDANLRGAFRKWAAPTALLSIAILILGLFFATERIPALARLLDNTALEDLRARILPILIDMAGDFQPWGTGLGAFEYVFRMREPIDLLGPAYVNEAHNDWLQFIIEGGLPAIAIIAIFAFAILRKVVHLVGHKSSPDVDSRRRWLGIGLLLVLGGASVVDYPLRVPSMMLLGIIAVAMVFQSRPDEDRGNRSI